MSDQVAWIGICDTWTDSTNCDCLLVGRFRDGLWGTWIRVLSFGEAGLLGTLRVGAGFWTSVSGVLKLERKRD